MRVPLSDRFFVIIRAPAGLAAFYEALHHDTLGAVKKEHKLCARHHIHFSIPRFKVFEATRKTIN